MMEINRDDRRAKFTRRDFLKTTAFLGGCTLLVSQVGRAFNKLSDIAQAAEGKNDFVYPLSQPENIIYTTCLQCHISCDLKVKLLDGVIVKIDGNPYSAQNMIPNISYEISPKDMSDLDGKVCPRGQAGVQIIYDPYRLVKVLKRNGPRGSNKWKTISFEQAITEIVEGGKLFADIGEDQVIPGLKEIFALRDAKIFKDMEVDAKKVGKKEMSVADFQKKYKNYLHTLIDPNHPDLGPKNNQFVFMAGRIQHGRKEFSQRIVKDSFGSINWFEHTTICEQSHHIAYDRMTSEYKFDEKAGKWKWDKGKTHMKPDLLNSEFVIFFGTGAFEANFGVTPMAEKVTYSLRERGFRYAVVDPRLSKTAAKAKWWVPIKPGTDAAFALGMIRWIIENNRYDKKFLENANKAAANADDEKSWSDATYLVKIENGKPTEYLRAKEVGLGEDFKFVVMRGGKLFAVHPIKDDPSPPVEGDLFVDTIVNGIKVKSVFQLLKESAFSLRLDEYANICGVKKEIIEELADEFTSHGKKAVAELYRGAVQHTNGFYNAQAIISLNLLIGNVDWKGGLSKGGGHWYEMGDKEGQEPPYKMKELHPGKLTAFGVPITREDKKYEESTLFEGYPAKRPWYPLTKNVYQEVIPSAGEGYPYPIKVLFNHKGTPLYSCPGGNKFIEVLRDPNKIPLIISCDILIGETTMYADYVFPDITYLERWGFPHTVPDVQSKISKVRNPAAPPIPEIVKVDGEEMPICLESVLLAIAKKLGLSGVGKDGFGPGMDFNRPEDYYLKLAANIAFGDKPGETVPDASDEEVDLFIKSRRHLPKAVFDPEKWKKALRENEWRKVIYVLNRGGRYEAFEKAYEGEHLHHAFKSFLRFYLEDVGKAKHPGTGKNFSPLPIYEPIKDFQGREIKGDGYEFNLITYKEIFHTQSRTPGIYWTLSIQPENYVLMNSEDARKLALKDGDLVKLTSSSNPQGIVDLGNGERLEVKGRVKVIEGVRPGVVVISHHYGHWAYGGSDIEVDGETIKGDERRRKGLSPNPLMLLDPALKDVCLSDMIGGSASFYDTFVKIEKV